MLPRLCYCLHVEQVLPDCTVRLPIRLLDQTIRLTHPLYLAWFFLYLPALEVLALNELDQLRYKVCSILWLGKQNLAF